MARKRLGVRKGDAAGALALLFSFPGVGAGQESGSVLRLREALEAALEHHPAVRVAEAGVEAGEARRAGAASARLPSLAFHTSLLRFQEPMLVAPIHKFDLMDLPELDRGLIQGELSAAYTIYDGGARGARLRAAQARVDAARAGVEVAEAEVMIQVVRAYLSAGSAREVLAAHERRVEALQEELRRAERFLAEGRTPQVSLLRAEAALAEAEAAGATSRARLRLAQLELARLTGIPEGRVAAAQLEGTGALEERTPSDRWPPSDAPGRHPGLLRATEEARAAEAAVAERRGTRFPAVSLGAAHSHFGQMSGQMSGEWRAALRLSYPVFTGGARESAVRGAEAGLRLARERIRLMELALESAIDRAQTARAEARSRLAALAAAEAQHAEVARIEALALREGAGVQGDYLRAEAALFAVRAALAEARHALAAAIVMEGEARGVLSLTWLTEIMEDDR